MNNKIVVGLIFGTILGAIDGATAWFTPEVRPTIAFIMMASAFKGLLVGLLCGWFARKVQSMRKGIALGAAIGLLFAYIVAAMGDEHGHHYYLEIMLPGFVVGAITGFLTQRMGAPAAPARS